MNRVVVFYNPFLPELKITVNGHSISKYSSLMRYKHNRLSDWCVGIFTELYSEVNAKYSMKCVSTQFVCECLKKIASKSQYCQEFQQEPLVLDDSVYERLARLKLLGYNTADEEFVIPIYNASDDNEMITAAFEIIEEQSGFTFVEKALFWNGCPLVNIVFRPVSAKEDITYRVPFILALCSSGNDCLPDFGETLIYALVMGGSTQFLMKQGMHFFWEVDPDDFTEVIFDILAEQALDSFLSKACDRFSKEQNSYLADDRKEQLELLCAAFPICRLSIPDILDVGRQEILTPVVYPNGMDVSLRIESVVSDIVAVSGNALTALREGSTEIRVFCGDDPYPAVFKRIQVQRRKLIQEIQAFPSANYIPVNGERELHVTYIPDNAENDTEICWISSDTLVATVDYRTGMVRGVGCGACFIEVSTREAKSRVNVYVQSMMTDILCPCSYMEIQAGEYREWRFKVIPPDSYGADTLRVLCSDKSIAEYRGGYIIGKKPGECKIYVKTQDSSISRELKVIVKRGKYMW